MAQISRNYHLQKVKGQTNKRKPRTPTSPHFFFLKSFLLVVYTDTYSEPAPFASSASEEEEWEESGPKGGEVLEVRQLGN